MSGRGVSIPRPFPSQALIAPPVARHSEPPKRGVADVGVRLPVLLVVLLGVLSAPARAQGDDRYRDTALDPKYCDAIGQEMARIAPGHSIEFDGGERKAGEPVPVGWTRQEAGARLPSYLVLAFDGPVRFRGDGFYALAPGGNMPFGLQFGAGKTRAVIPLQQSGIETSGSFSFVPLRAGELTVDLALVTATGCKPVIENEESRTLTIVPGKPVVQVADPFDVSKPDEVLRSPAGGRAIEIFADHWRLVDETTGLTIAERAGRDPRFSPGGRFVTAIGESTIELVDTVDGAVVSSMDAFDSGFVGQIGWLDGDSFVVLGSGSMGGLALYSTLVENRLFVSSLPSCNACSALFHSALLLDLENNVVRVGDYNATEFAFAEARSLTAPLGYDTLGMTEGSDQYKNADEFVYQTSAVVRLSPLPAFVEHPGIVFTQAGGTGDARDEVEERLASAAEAATVEPLREAPGAMASAGDSTGNATPRGAVALAAGPRDLGDRMKRRINDFGIPLYDHVPARAVENLLEPAGEGQDGFLTYEIFTLPAENDLRFISAPLGMSCGVAEQAEDGKLEVNFGTLAGVLQIDASGGRKLYLINGACNSGSGGFINAAEFLYDTAHPGEIVDLQNTLFHAADAKGTDCPTTIFGCDYRAALAQDRYILMWSADSRAAAVYDIDKRQVHASLVSLPGASTLDDVSISPDGGTLVQLDGDGSFALFDLAAQPGSPTVAEPRSSTADGAEADWRPQVSPMLDGLYNDDEIVVWTDGGFYDATYEGAAQVSLRLPGVDGRYSIRQFDALLRREGLAEQVLEHRFDTPDIQLEAPPTVKVSITGAAETLDIDLATTSGGTPKKVLVFQDGLLTDEIAADGRRDLSLKVARRPGAREITAMAIDRNGLSSLPMGREITPPPTGSGRRLLAIAVGVDDYSDERLADLSFAASDAARFDHAIDGGSALYSQIDTQLLTNSEATPDKVLGLISEALSRSSADTDIMLFFAGHGLQADDGRYFLALGGTDLDDVEHTALAWDAISKLIAGSRARITVFLDACHSGLAGRGMFATNDGAVDDLLSAVPSGVSVFAASKGREQSLETARSGGGVFTAALASTLSENRARYDLDGDGILDASEAFRGIKQQVVEATGGAQTPWFARNEAIGDFPLF